MVKQVAANLFAFLGTLPSIVISSSDIRSYRFTDQSFKHGHTLGLGFSVRQVRQVWRTAGLVIMFKLKLLACRYAAPKL